VPFSVFAREYNPAANNFSQWLQLSVVRYSIVNHLRMEDPHRYKLPFWLIYRNLDPGAVIIDERDDRTPLDPGVIVVLPAWQEWRYFQPVDGVRHIVIGVDLPQMSPSLVRKHFLGAQVIVGVGTWKRELLAMREIADELEASEIQTTHNSCKVQGLCFRVFERMMERLPRFETPPEPVRRVIDHVDRDLSADLRQPTLERIAGCGMKRLNRDFHVAYGVSAAGYIRERRISRTADLLINSDWNLDRIADAVGFGNRSYLSRAFSLVIGTSPSLYREQRRLS
jgi:AraC-like DNA-binding protein